MPQGITQAGIQGFDNVIKNLSKEIQAIEDRTPAGLLQVANFVRRDMDITPPVIPVDTGVMRGSWQVHPRRANKQIGITMGFYANYSLWVHEMVGADFTTPKRRKRKDGKTVWTTPRPGAGAKFFEACLNRNHTTLLQIILSATQIP